MADEIGAMRERLTIQENAPVTLSLVLLTASATTATATADRDHGYTSGDYITIAGAAPTGYNGKVRITVTGARTFTYTVGAGLTSPATNAITAVYASDSQGGRKVVWRTLAEVWAEMVPLSASERIQHAAIQSDTTYRFRIRARTDLDPTQRLLWTPRWPPGQPPHTLEINGIVPFEDGTVYSWLECAESPAP